MKRKLIKFLGMLFTFGIALPVTLLSLYDVASAVDTTTTTSEPVISRNGCQRVIETTEEVKWELPRQPIDLVILQDTSGSFKNTIANINAALTTLTTPVSAADYKHEDPKLIFTDNPDTTDRVMIATYQGLDTVRRYRGNDFSDSASYTLDAGTYGYNKTSLISNQAQLKSFIDQRLNKAAAEGGTPTVPAIDDAVRDYLAAKQAAGHNDKRKTVFLLITDGVANGYRDTNGTEVFIDESDYRWGLIAKTYGFDRQDTNGNWYTTDSSKLTGLTNGKDYTTYVNNGYYYYYFNYAEGAQDFVKRSKELVDRGTRLKAELGENSDVVIGFWEDKPNFVVAQQYGKGYEQDYLTAYNIQTGESRSVRQTFQDSLKTMSSGVKENPVTGEKVDLYVNEQGNVDLFAQKVLKAVAAAMVRENVEGDFTVTDGYTVDAVRINNKTVVEEPTDLTKQIRGTVKQVGNKVTISVPESVFNPGNNNFEYDLSKQTESENVSEDDEVDPSDDYTPAKETITIPQLTGKFKVGNYETAEIGGKTPTTREVEEIKYCYPSSTKTITDQDTSNDAGTIDDPLKLSKKPAYGANLTAADETFTYTVNYRFNNSPYEWKENAMLVDPLDYRFEVVDAKVEDLSGFNLNYKVEQVTQKDAKGNDRTVVYAKIPEKKGTKAEDKGPYDGLVMKQARLVVTVKLKAEYREQGTKAYSEILNLNKKYGISNQASIMWNGGSTPNNDEHATKYADDGKTVVSKSTMRNSNAVYVKPPVVTEIEKAVNNAEHYDLKEQAEEFEYAVTVPWPGLVDSFKIEDQVVSELEIVEGSETVSIGAKDYTSRAKPTIEDNKITVDFGNASKIKALNSLVEKDYDKDPSQEMNIVLKFKAKIRSGADVSKYTKNGVIKIPNTADVTLNGNKPITSNEVTVTPPKPTEPEIKKTINGSLNNLVTFDDLPYTYNIVTDIPTDIATYKKFVIKDTLDSNLVIAGDVTIKDEATAALFDIKTEGQLVTATVKEGKFADLAKLSNVELIIPAKVKVGVIGTTIENKASVDFTNSKDEEKTKETDPVTVTPPTPTKKINKELDHLDIENEGRYVYNVTVKLPTDIGSYKSFVISDELNKELSFFVKDGAVEKATISGAAADFFTVEQSGQTVTATIKDFEAAAAFAGQEVELVIPASINKDVKTVNIPNVAKINYTDSKNVKGEKPTNKVTVTPPGELPKPVKTVDTKDALTLDTMNQVFTYDVTVTVPENTTGYTKFELTDDLVDILTITETKFEAGTVTSPADANAASGKVVASIPVEKLAEFAGKEVTLTIKAKIKDGTTAEALKPFLNADGAIPNKANLSVGDKPGQNKDSNEVPVTPPSEDPTVEKKINKTETHLDTATETNYNYNITTKLPLDITAYKKFVITDELDQDLAIQGTPVITGDAARFFDVKVEGQVVTATMKDFANAGELATKEVELVISAQIRKGVTRQEIPNTAKVTYTNKSGNDGEKETKPVTVTPPGEDPTVEKKINGTLEHLDTLNEAPYTYNITAKLPVDITSYKKFVISDEVNGEIAVAGANVLGDAAKFFDVKVEGQTVTATMKDFKDAKALAGKPVELVITAHIKPGVTTAKIPNTAKITYQNKSHVDGTPDTTKDTPPVTVTPPPLTKKINDKLDSLDIENKKDYNYNIKTVVPGNIA
ncbi:isopeptide-forming domain-containing fimbrial protein, partial [Streptococcus caprae]